MILGIDISNYQQVTVPVNFDLVKQSGIKFIIVKATEGAKHVDNSFSNFWYNIKRINIPGAAYHYYRPLHDKQAQAKLFFSTTGFVTPIIDVELFKKYLDDVAYYKNTPKDVKRADLKKLLDWTEYFFGVKPIIYTGYYFWRDNFSPCDWAKDYKLWIAAYTSLPPLIPADWKEHILHQFTSSGTVPGIDGGVDMDKTTLTEDEIKKLFRFSESGQEVKISTIENKIIKIYTNKLNIRAYPSTVAPKVGYVTSGDELPELEEKIIEDCVWARVGVNQWVAKIYKGYIYAIYKTIT
jgi:GH25 family lysozyme M1 (1,4-beta-N-acetylmuramidase)